jgi:hypothetical protein
VNTALTEVSNTPEVCPNAETATLRQCEFSGDFARAACKNMFQPKNAGHRFCSQQCRIDNFRKPERMVSFKNKNDKFRSRYLTFDGRLGGSLSSSGKDFSEKQLKKLREKES